MKFNPIDLRKLRTHSIRSRRNLVNLSQFAQLIPPNRSFKAFINSLPDLLAGKAFKKLIKAITQAYRQKRMVACALGAHVVKCGLAPIIIDLMERGIIKAIALHGASAIHDYEISLIGATSEDVTRSVKSGQFGMAKETASVFARATQQALWKNSGLGATLGGLIIQDKNRYARFSILAAAYRLGIPATVHMAIGTDTIHMHPNISGEALGESTLIDFKIIASVVAQLNRGVWLNIGSAVILPEVFLKAVSIARNLGYKLNQFTTANFDMIQHYRPITNVTGRVTPHGINITGHHEIMLPLLRLGILAELGVKR